MTQPQQVLYRYSSIARVLDPHYFTNLLIMVLTVLSGVAAGVLTLITGGSFTSAIAAGIAIGSATLITWVISREIDPDHDWAAFVSVVLVWVAGWFLRAPMPGLVALVLMVVYVRVVNRTVGPPAKLNDSLVLLAGTVIAAAFDNWIIIAVVAGAFLADGLLPEAQRRNLIFALLALVVMGARIVLLDWTSVGVLSIAYTAGIALVSVAFMMTVLATRTVSAVCDMDGYTLRIQRVRAGMALVLGGALAVSLWNGDQGVLWMLPAWCGMLGVTLFRIRVTIQQWIAFQRARKGA